MRSLLIVALLTVLTLSVAQTSSPKVSQQERVQQLEEQVKAMERRIAEIEERLQPRMIPLGSR
jgi:peptidoglycan hydrolase CwlO-like protein